MKKFGAAVSFFAIFSAAGNGATCKATWCHLRAASDACRQLRQPALVAQSGLCADVCRRTTAVATRFPLGFSAHRIARLSESVAMVNVRDRTMTY